MKGARRPAPAGARRRRAVVDYSGAQTAENTIHNAAGGDITHGADPDLIVNFLKDYMFLDRQEREKRTIITDNHNSFVRIGVIVLVVLAVAIFALQLVMLVIVRY